MNYVWNCLNISHSLPLPIIVCPAWWVLYHQHCIPTSHITFSFGASMRSRSKRRRHGSDSRSDSHSDSGERRSLQERSSSSRRSKSSKLGWPKWYRMIEGSLEVKLLTIWADGKAEVGRVSEKKRRRKKIREEKESEERRCMCAKR